MKSIPRPIKNINDILDLFLSDNPHFKTKKSININRANLILLEEQYITKIKDNTLYQIIRGVPNNISLTKDELKKYYEYRLLSKSNARAFYDTILLSAPNNICPYCTIKNVKTIDHFLPKSEYPYLSVTPSNLVPSCRDCNTEKKISYPKDSDTQTFHPYFDSEEDASWIKAELMLTEPLSFQFKVERLPNWNNNKFSRALNHFNAYNINVLFSNEANRELRARQLAFKSLIHRDKILLQDNVIETYKSCLVSEGANDWRTITYKCLMENTWFLQGCNGNSYFN